MGYAIAEVLAKRGAEVTLVSGPVTNLRVAAGIKLVNTTSAKEMYEACLENQSADIAVMAAAVADYTPVRVAPEKIKKSNLEFSLSLVKTEDILATLGSRKKEGQVLVGFALETEREEENAMQKLNKKNADMIVLNSLKDSGAGFGKETNKITVYFKNGSKRTFDTKQKIEVAKDIVDAIIEIL
jgi:phosphopantothenoylcysteine decarboxylase/phosphopantothenate--cysteine ligase